MLSCIKHFIVIFLTLNLFAANGKGPIEIGDSEDITTHTRTTMDATGQYMYSIQVVNDGTNDIVKITRSADNGSNWGNPTTTTGDGGTPNLSKNGQNARHPQLATDSTGQYVYAIWQRDNGSRYIIQVAVSSDYGANWTNPTIVPGDESPDLSDSKKSAFEPQISTDSTGQYIFAIWQRNNGFESIMQIAVSSDYGVTWRDPLMGRCSLFLE